MRTSIVVLCIIMLSACATYAQKPPAAVSAAFAKSYPEAKGVKWENEEGKYEASFKQAGKEMSVTYHNDGTVAEIETSIALNELPNKALAYVQSKGKVKEACRIVTATGTVQYEAEVKDTDFMFDENGNLIEAKTKKEDDKD